MKGLNGMSDGASSSVFQNHTCLWRVLSTCVPSRLVFFFFLPSPVKVALGTLSVYQKGGGCLGNQGKNAAMRYSFVSFSFACGQNFATTLCTSLLLFIHLIFSLKGGDDDKLATIQSISLSFI